MNIKPLNDSVLVLRIEEEQETSGGKKFRCPECRSTRVKQQITPFQTKTSSKS